MNQYWLNYILETTETQPKVGTSTFGSIHGIDHYYHHYPHPNFNIINIIILSSPPLYLLAGAKWLHPWHWDSSAHCLAQSAAVTTWSNNIKYHRRCHYPLSSVSTVLQYNIIIVVISVVIKTSRNRLKKHAEALPTSQRPIKTPEDQTITPKIPKKRHRSRWP